MATTTILQRVCFLPLLMALLNMSGICAGGGHFGAGPVVESGATGRSALGYRLQGWKWEKELLSYKISSFPAYLGLDSVKEEFKKAFEVWANVTNLSFHEATVWGEKVDIEISFGGDFNPGVLAYSVHSGEGASMRFNPDFKFSIDYTDFNLLQIAAREIGYSLGLYYSTNEKALMYREYSEVERTPLLSDDDVEGIQALYKPKRKPKQEAQGEGNETDQDHRIVKDVI